MKAVLLSIKPRYCELIASGKKTIEIRKTRPKLATPFKVYIYETKGYETLFGKDKPMECGEEREFKQSCIDDEIIIEALKPYTSDKPQTHFDRIKAMNVEEMAEDLTKLFYEVVSYTNAKDYIKQYLESEVQEDEP